MLHWLVMQPGHDNKIRDGRNIRVASQFFAPPAGFENCFTTFYRLEFDDDDGSSVEDFLHPEWTNIRFFSGATPTAQIVGGDELKNARFTATGPSSLANRFVIAPTRMWGLGFLPLGWARFFDADARDAANLLVDGETHPLFARFAPLADLLCDPDASSEEQFDAIMAHLGQIARPYKDEQRILQIHDSLLDQDLNNVTEFAEASDMTVRTLERMCMKYFGFSPKLLLRRQRMMRTLTAFLLNPGGNWSDAIDEHYHDQAHFTREFRAFMGMKPSEYAALDHPILESFVRARAESWGSPAQTLDRPRL